MISYFVSTYRTVRTTSLTNWAYNEWLSKNTWSDGELWQQHTSRIQGMAVFFNAFDICSHPQACEWKISWCLTMAQCYCDCFCDAVARVFCTVRERERERERVYSWSEKFTYTFQNLLNVNYFTKIRGIVQNACYFLFSTDLNKIFHIKDVYI